MSRPPRPPSDRVSALLVLLVVSVLAAEAAAGKKGFADKPAGGKDDARIGVLASIAPNFAGVVAPKKKKHVAPCGSYTVDPSLGRMVVPVPRLTFPTGANGGNQFLLLQFPFPIDKKKARKSLYRDDPFLAGTSFLTSNLLVTDENGTHVPGIAVIGGRNAQGDDVSQHPSFPWVVDAKGNNLLLRDDVLVYLADDGDQDLATAAAFGALSGDPQSSAIASLRVRLQEVAGITMHGAWNVARGDLTGAPAVPLPPALLSVTPTKPVEPPELSGGHVVVKRKTDFVLTFSEPVVPLSVGVEKQWIKALGGVFTRNLGAAVNPCDGTPIFPNVEIEWVPDGGPPELLGFDVRSVNPNNETQFRLRVLDTPKGSGDLVVRLLPLSENLNVHPIGFGVRSSVTSWYDVPFDDLATSEQTFRVE